MRFVAVKSVDQQALLMLHRVRDQLVGQRTATINALRGHLAELGIVAARRRGGLAELLMVVGDLDDQRVPPLGRELLQTLVASLRELEGRIGELDRRLVQTARAAAPCVRLAEVPGIGPVISTALVATVSDARAFKSGRHLAAWLGLVPRQHSSGGKERTLGLSKRGDGYLRRQLIHGARSVVRVARGREGGFWGWINRLLERRPFNVVVSAVANKLARIAWVLLARNEIWRSA
jgi:transposase